MQRPGCTCRKGVLLASGNCCRLCSDFSHFASTVAVFIHFAAFLCASPLGQPQIKMLQKHTCLETKRQGQRTEKHLLISVPASDDRKPETTAVTLKLPALGANWASSGDSRHYSAAGWSRAIGYRGKKSGISLSNTGSFQVHALTYSLVNHWWPQASFNRVIHVLASCGESRETCFQVPQ